MKRTKLSLAALAALSACSLVGCDGDDEQADATVAGSIQDCVNAGVPAAQCADAWAKASQEHERTAPRYGSAGDCYAEFGPGQCQPMRSSNGSDVFVPLMAGIMIGNMMNNHSNGGVVVVHSYHPLYRTVGGGGFRTAANETISGTGSVKVSSSYLSPKPISTTTLSRGGFGSMGAARASWGGGGHVGGFGG